MVREFNPREWEVYAAPDCSDCDGTGQVRSNDPRYRGPDGCWCWCNCAIKNKARRIELALEALG